MRFGRALLNRRTPRSPTAATLPFHPNPGPSPGSATKFPATWAGRGFWKSRAFREGAFYSPHSRLRWRNPQRPRVATRGYPEPQLRSSIRRGIALREGASKSPHSRLSWRNPQRPRAAARGYPDSFAARWLVASVCVAYPRQPQHSQLSPNPRHGKGKRACLLE